MEINAKIYFIVKQLDSSKQDNNMLLQHTYSKDSMRRVTRIKPSAYLLPKFKADIIQHLIMTRAKGLTQLAFNKISQFSKQKQECAPQQYKYSLQCSDKIMNKTKNSNIDNRAKIEKKSSDTQTPVIEASQISIQTQDMIEQLIKAALKQQSIKFAAKSVNRCLKCLQIRVKMKVFNKIKIISSSPYIPRLRICKKQSISQTLDFIHENRQKYEQFSEIIQELQDQLQLKTIQYEELHKKYNILINTQIGTDKNIAGQESKSVVSEGEKTDNASSSGMNKSLVLKCTTVTYLEDETASPPRTPRNEAFKNS